MLTGIVGYSIGVFTTQFNSLISDRNWNDVSSTAASITLFSPLEKLVNDGTVTRIALKVGYEPSSAFLVAFRFMFGLTLRQYLSNH